MTTIYPRLAIDFGGIAPYYFPPYGEGWGARVRRGQGATPIVADDPTIDGEQLISTARSATRFELEGQIQEATAADARTQMQNMILALRGGPDETFRFFWFHDQYWKKCFVEHRGDLEFDLTRAPFGVIGYRVRFAAGDPQIYTDDTVGPGPYEDVIYPGETGSAQLMTKQKTSYAVMFAGELAVTPTGYDCRIVPDGESGGALAIVSIQAAANQCLGSSGQTLLRVSAAAKGGSTADSILLTINHDELNKRATGNFTIDVGETLYVYCEASAGHQNVSVNIVVEG